MFHCRRTISSSLIAKKNDDFTSVIPLLILRIQTTPIYHRLCNLIPTIWFRVDWYSCTAKWAVGWRRIDISLSTNNFFIVKNNLPPSVPSHHNKPSSPQFDSASIGMWDLLELADYSIVASSGHYCSTDIILIPNNKRIIHRSIPDRLMYQDNANIWQQNTVVSTIQFCINWYVCTAK